MFLVMYFTLKTMLKDTIECLIIVSNRVLRLFQFHKGFDPTAKMQLKDCVMRPL